MHQQQLLEESVNSLDFIQLLSPGFAGSVGALVLEQLGNARNVHGEGDEAMGEGAQPAGEAMPSSVLGNWTSSDGSCDSLPVPGAAPGWTDSRPPDSQAADVQQTEQQAPADDGFPCPALLHILGPRVRGCDAHTSLRHTVPGYSSIPGDDVLAGDLQMEKEGGEQQQ